MERLKPSGDNSENYKLAFDLFDKKKGKLSKQDFIDKLSGAACTSIPKTKVKEMVDEIVTDSEGNIAITEFINKLQQFEIPLNIFSESKHEKTQQEDHENDDEWEKEVRNAARSNSENDMSDIIKKARAFQFDDDDDEEIDNEDEEDDDEEEQEEEDDQLPEDDEDAKEVEENEVNQNELEGDKEREEDKDN